MDRQYQKIILSLLKKKKKRFIDTNNLTPIDKKWFGSEFRREPVQVVTLAKYRDSLAKPISEGENGLLPFFKKKYLAKCPSSILPHFSNYLGKCLCFETWFSKNQVPI